MVLVPETFGIDYENVTNPVRIGQNIGEYCFVGKHITK